MSFGCSFGVVAIVLVTVASDIATEPPALKY